MLPSPSCLGPGMVCWVQDLVPLSPCLVRGQRRALRQAQEAVTAGPVCSPTSFPIAHGLRFRQRGHFPAAVLSPSLSLTLPWHPRQDGEMWVKCPLRRWAARGCGLGMGCCCKEQEPLAGVKAASMLGTVQHLERA